jgi:hypothetical protein
LLPKPIARRNIRRRGDGVTPFLDGKVGIRYLQPQKEVDP